MKRNKLNTDIENSEIIEPSLEPTQENSQVSKQNTKDSTNDIKLLQTQVENLQKTMKDLKLRAQAEIENVCRRNKVESQNIQKYSLETFMLALLPVVDSLEMALKETKNNIQNSQATVEGIKLTLTSFLDVLKKFGASKINKKKVEFNPNIHQAISTQISEQYHNNTVIEILQCGYVLHGRLLRPASVIVSKSS